MALVTCAGADVLRGEFHFAQRGPWWLQLELDTAIAPSGAVTIAAANGFTLKGTVAVGGVFADIARVTIIGGAGGLGTIVPAAAYRNAQLGDPLNAILRASGESLSSTVSAGITGTELTAWSQVAQRALTALDLLAYTAGQALSETVVWRTLDDGTVWIGSETWPSATLPATDYVADVASSEGRYIIAAETPSLLPGVALAGVGNVVAVDHFLTADELRTWAWVS